MKYEELDLASFAIGEKAGKMTIKRAVFGNLGPEWTKAVLNGEYNKEGVTGRGTSQATQSAGSFSRLEKGLDSIGPVFQKHMLDSKVTSIRAV